MVRADEVTVTVHNADGACSAPGRRRPATAFSFSSAYVDQLVPAGTFTVETKPRPSDSAVKTVDFKGLAAPKTEALRTPRHKDYEDASLSDIVGEIAGRHGFIVRRGRLTICGLSVLTQDGESDTEFLMRWPRITGTISPSREAGAVRLARRPARRGGGGTIDRLADMGNT